MSQSTARSRAGKPRVSEPVVQAMTVVKPVQAVPAVPDGQLIEAPKAVALKPAKAKPPRFPLWLHRATGQWTCKRHRKFFYFGTDKDAALKEWTRVKDDIEAGRPIQPDWQESDRLTLKELCNYFLDAKETKADAGEITRRTFADYRATCRLVLEHFGTSVAVEEIKPADLLAMKTKWVKLWGVHRLGNEIAKTRVLLKFAFENGLVDKQIRFGDFKRPAKSAYRRRRAEVGSRMFEPADLATILEACDIQLKAMVLLGLNAGFGNNDCGTLPIKALDVKRGWLDHARPKTGIPRRVPLWPETVEALKAVLANRKEPTDKKHSGLVFITKYGGPWFHDEDKSRAAPLSAEFRKLLQGLKLHRTGASFYSLRHVFQTIGEETGDNVAIRRIMGHADDSMSDIYRERFPDERLQRVVDHVRSWVFPPKPAKAGKRGAE